MSDQNYDRFRRLERPRAGGPAEAPRSSGTDARIEAVEGPTPPAPATGAPAPSGGDLERFRAPAATGLELDVTGDDAQPFRRCASCETDNYRTAPRCTTCGADLESEPQLAFNQRFWAARRAEAAAEAGAATARRLQQEAAVGDEATLRRAQAEALARQVGEAERYRLEQEGFGPGWNEIRDPDWTGPTVGGGWPTPLLLRGLRSLPTGWAIAVGTGLLLVPVVLYMLWPLAGFVAGAILLVTILPARRRPWYDWRNWT